jgi:hypothetical protein
MAFDFPNAPTVGQIYQGWSWDGEKWLQAVTTPLSGAVRYDIAQGLTANQMAQARSNDGMMKKNYIINGGMQVSQENGATAGTANGYYPVDMFGGIFSNAGTPTLQQVAVATPGGSPNRLRVTATAAHAAVAAGDYLFIGQNPEGFRVADLRFGSAAAKTFIVQFGVKAPAGTYSMSFVNAAANRTYVAEYVIAAGEANTDVVKSVVVPGDVTGTWAVDNTAGVYIRWSLMCGTTNQLAAGAWSAGNFQSSPNQFNLMGAVNNVFELFDVGLYEGNVAPAFMVPDYASELALCKRYWQKLGGDVATDCIISSGYSPTAGAGLGPTIHYPVAMRAIPASAFVGAWTPVNVSNLTPTVGTRSLYYSIAVTGTGVAYTQNGAGAYISLNARL